MSIHRRTVCLAAVVLTLSMGGHLPAQSVPFEQQYSTSRIITRSAAIVVPAQFHPRVAVSRTLAAQPVYPHMVKVILGGVQPDNNGATMHTWIDPLRRLDGEDGLDESHSLVKAQRLFLSLGNYSTREINELRARSRRLESTFATQSKARLIVSPKAGMTEDAPIGPVMILPAPGPAQPDESEKLIAGADR